MRSCSDVQDDSAIDRLAFGEFYGPRSAAVSTTHLSVLEILGRPPGGVPRHTHEEPHFCLIVDSAYRTETKNLSGRCPALTLLYHPAGTTHEDTFDGTAGTAVLISMHRQALETMDLPRLADRSVAFDDAELGFPGLRMHQELLAADSASGLTLEALSLEMVAAASRRPETLDRRAPAWLDDARQLIRARAHEPMKVADIAAAIGLHPVHLARSFRRHLGVSPGDVLRRARVGRAVKLLRSDDGRIADIAVECGFCDQADLTKAFRRELGTTPAALRCGRRRRQRSG